MAESAIANASPIILWARAGYIELLHVFSDEVIVLTELLFDNRSAVLIEKRLVVNPISFDCGLGSTK